MSERIVKYGDFTLDFNALPEQSLMAMLRRGVSHFFGSEVASKVKAYFDSEDDDGNKPERTDEANAAKLAEIRADFLAKLEGGTVGVSTRGPAVDPITTITRQIAREEVKEILARNGVKWPKKSTDTVEFADGRKLTGTELIDRRVNDPKHAERLATEAKAEAKRREAEAAKKAKKVAAATEQDELGAL